MIDWELHSHDAPSPAVSSVHAQPRIASLAAKLSMQANSTTSPTLYISLSLATSASALVYDGRFEMVHPIPQILRLFSQ